MTAFPSFLLTKIAHSQCKSWQHTLYAGIVVRQDAKRLLLLSWPWFLQILFPQPTAVKPSVQGDAAAAIPVMALQRKQVVSMMSDLKLLDAMLTLSGNRLSTRLFGIRCLGTISNLLMRLLITFGTVTVFINNAPLITDTSKIGVTAVQLSTTALPLFSLTFGLFFAGHRQWIKDLLRSLEMSQQTREFVRKMSVRLLCLTITGSVIGTSCVVIMIMPDVRDALSLLMTITVLLPMILNQFLVIYPSCYLISFKILADYEANHLMRMQKQDLSINGCFLLIRQLKRLTQAKQQFDQHLNHIPFLVFSITFITVPGCIASVSGKNSGQKQVSEVIAFITIQAIIAGVLIAIVLTVCCSKQRMDRLLDDFIWMIQQKQSAELLTRSQNAALISLMHALSKVRDFEFTGASLFTINRSLFLSFASALISISVLVLQMIN